MSFSEFEEHKFSVDDVANRFFDRTDWNLLMSLHFGLKTRIFGGKVLGDYVYLSFQEDVDSLYANYIGYGGTFCSRFLKESEFLEVIRTIESLTKKRFKRIKLYPFNNFSSLDVGKFQARTTSVLNLKLPETYTKGTWYEIRKAQRRGCYTHFLESARDLDAFYSVYLETVKRVGGVLYHAKESFLGDNKPPGVFYFRRFF